MKNNKKAVHPQRRHDKGIVHQVILWMMRRTSRLHEEDSCAEFSRELALPKEP